MSSTRSWMKTTVEQYGAEYVFRQMAEEAAELCHAALKMVRVMNNETPVRWEIAQAHLLEEMADVRVMWDMIDKAVLNDDASQKMWDIMWKKADRMQERMLEGDQTGDDS